MATDTLTTDAPATYVTREEYLAMERSPENRIRHEWIDGEVRDMSGASHFHGLVVGNVSFHLMSSLKGRPYVVHSHDMKVRIPDSAYYYPDLVVVPHPPEFEDERSDIVLNPLVVVEIPSPSTQSVDRGEKLDGYRRIPSLTDYLIVTRERPSVDHWSNRDDGEWRLDILEDLTAEATLSSLECTLPLAAVYERLFDAEPGT